MVTLNCVNCTINIFKAKFKTSFKRNEYAANNDLWFQIILKNGPPQNVDYGDDDECPEHEYHKQLNENEKSKDKADDSKAESTSEFTLSIVKKFVQDNATKISKLIDINLQLCANANSDQLKVLRIFYTWEMLFINVEFNLFYSNQYLSTVLKSAEVLSCSDERFSVRIFQILTC